MESETHLFNYQVPRRTLSEESTTSSCRVATRYRTTSTSLLCWYSS